MRSSRLAISIVLCAVFLLHPIHGVCQKTDNHENHPTPVTPKEKLQDGTAQAIRDFIQLLYPSWGDLSFDLLVSGRRSMNPYYGITWSFAVVPRSELIIYGFSPSSTPCSNPNDCFAKLELKDPLLVGRFSQRGSRILAYEASRPEVTQKNVTFLQSVKAEDSLTDIEAGLLKVGAKYVPSSEKGLREHLQASALFLKYGFRIDRLQYCRTTPGFDGKKPAMFWSAHVFSNHWQRRFLVTVEPFEGDVTSLLGVTKKEEAAMGCEN